MPASQMISRIRFILFNLGDEPAAFSARIIVSAVWQLRRILRVHGDPNLRVSPLDPATSVMGLQRLADQLKERAIALAADNRSPERQALHKRL
jgi:hypothetical protein